MSCQCYKIGGPFIAEDPDCPAHGYIAQLQRDLLETRSHMTFDEWMSSISKAELDEFFALYMEGKFMEFAEAAFEAGKDLMTLN